MTRVEVPGHDLVGIRAANPGPFTLSGTNSWIVGRDPAWLVDPGPNLDEHVEALIAEIERRGGLGGVALTHHHGDHTEAVPAIRARYPDAPLARGPRGSVDDAAWTTGARSVRSRRCRRPATLPTTSRTSRARPR